MNISEPQLMVPNDEHSISGKKIQLLRSYSLIGWYKRSFNWRHHLLKTILLRVEPSPKKIHETINCCRTPNSKHFKIINAQESLFMSEAREATMKVTTTKMEIVILLRHGEKTLVP